MSARRLVLGAVVVGATLIAGCEFNKGSPAGNDNPNIKTDNQARFVYENPEDFPNVVVFCDGTTRVYLTQREQRPIILVVDDKQCGGSGGRLVAQPQ